MIQNSSLSVVFPMWNEEENIRHTVSITGVVLESFTEDYEIIIVDDCSTDGSGAIADELARDNPKITVIHLPVNSKLGGALRAGFQRASKEYILYSDSDLPFDMEEIKRALRILFLTRADIVTAYRHDRTTEGFVRTLYSMAYNILIRILFGVRVRDINFSLKLFKRKILDEIQLTSNGSFIDAELIILCHRKGYKIVQFGIDYFQRLRGKSTLSGTRVIGDIIKELTLFRLRR